jgi:cytochrome c-type biogenesis protein CcmH
MKTLAALLLICALFIATPGFCLTPSDILQDPAQEARARALTHQIRCPVCAGEALDESNAELARDLRRLVRERITAGDSDAEIFLFLQERYGEGILMHPPVDGRTLLLWLLPLVVVAAGLRLFWRRCQKQKDGTP